MKAPVYIIELDKKGHNKYALYSCGCGRLFRCMMWNINSGHTKSCGCIKLKHGEARNRKLSSEYILWQHIKARCYNKKDARYKDYGGRGIRMYPPWRFSYINFRTYLIQTIGRKPNNNYSIDRIDNNGDYAPGNIRWATSYEQSNNRRSKQTFKV